MKLAIALDLPTLAKNHELIEKIAQLPEELTKRVAFKVGLNLFAVGGPLFIKDIQEYPQFEIALDLKLHDIPNTMVEAVKRIADLGVQMFTVHAAAGAEALSEVRRTLNHPSMSQAPKMLAVTVLTSMSNQTCERVYASYAKEQVSKMIIEALHGGSDGIVCSPLELPLIEIIANTELERQGPIPRLIKFVPGIELVKRNDDQKRKGGLKEVIEGGADYIVVGRPIYQASDPAAVVRRLLTKIDALEKLKSSYEDECRWE